MIFGKGLIPAILAGEKTVTRRTSTRYRPGSTYAVQPGRGLRGVARIRVTDVRREPLGRLSDEEVAKEGFESQVDFAKYWISMHGRYDEETMVSRIEFELIEETS